MGKSGRSTSIKIGADCTVWPEVAPTAVKGNFLQAMLLGIVIENVAGTEVATVVNPIGSSPTTPTPESEAFAGEVTDTETVCPGLTSVPLAGDAIWSSGAFCWAGSPATRESKKSNAPTTLTVVCTRKPGSGIFIMSPYVTFACFDRASVCASPNTRAMPACHTTCSEN